MHFSKNSKNVALYIYLAVFQDGPPTPVYHRKTFLELIAWQRNILIKKAQCQDYSSDRDLECILFTYYHAFFYWFAVHKVKVSINKNPKIFFHDSTKWHNSVNRKQRRPTLLKDLSLAFIVGDYELNVASCDAKFGKMASLM